MNHEKSKFIKNYIYLVILLLIVIGLIFGIIYWRRDIKKVCFSNECFSVELAKTAAEQQKGLMNRKSLATNAGMLFIFNSPGKYPFWMKNTKISLDIIWLDAKGKVITIQSAEPCTTEDCINYIPTGDAKYVLEINHDAASDVIKVGTTARFVK